MFIANRTTRSLLLLAASVCLYSSGCSTVACKAVPVGRLPRWVLAEPRANREPINMISLRMDPEEHYRLGPRDILGIYIHGVLGQQDEPPPVHFPEQGNIAPAMGYPIPIRDDGALVLPIIDPIKVTGMTLSQAEEEVVKRYIEAQVLAPGKVKVLVTLMRKRTNQILVIREDSGAAPPSSGVFLAGPAKRGSVFSVDLPSDESDVMHALAESGGLPGLDAKNEIVILRGTFADAKGRNSVLSMLSTCGPYAGPNGIIGNNPNVLRIPLRAEPGMPRAEFGEKDIILKTGDIIFIETREREVFYTGGLLPGKQIPIPRDYDLDVLAAISLAGSSVASGATAGSGSLGRAGGGGGSGGIIPATQIIVVRQLPNGTTLPIRIDLKKALANGSDRILIQSGDYIVLEYKPSELVANIILGNLSFNYFLNNVN